MTTRTAAGAWAGYLFPADYAAWLRFLRTVDFDSRAGTTELPAIVCSPCVRRRVFSCDTVVKGGGAHMKTAGYHPRWRAAQIPERRLDRFALL